MPKGAIKKLENENEKLEERLHKTGHYKRGEEKAAAQLSNKQLDRFGESESVKEEVNEGEWPDQSMPIKGYDSLTVDQVAKELNSLSRQEVQRVKSYEQKHKKRKTLIEQLDLELSKQAGKDVPEVGFTTSWSWIVMGGVGALIALWLIF
jgi:hypothetical protein